jgi:hypothetical protein
MTGSPRDILDWDTRVRAAPAQTMDIRVVSTVAHEAAGAHLRHKKQCRFAHCEAALFDLVAT